MSKDVAKPNQVTDLQVIESPLQHFLQLTESGVAIAADARDIKLNNFTRLEEGENRFRLIYKPVYGAEVWFRRVAVNEETGEALTNDDGSPKMESSVKRYKAGEPIIVPSEYRGWQKDKARKFIGLLAYNYKTGGVEILTVSQSKLFDDLFDKLKYSPDNVNPFKSDLKVTKKFDSKKLIGGKMMDIYSYTVGQTKENDPSVEMLKSIEALPFLPDMDSLFTGGDPFEVQDAEIVGNHE